MADDGLVITISARAEKFEEAMGRVGQKVESLNGYLEKLGIAASVIFAAATAEIYESVKAYGAQETAANTLTQSLKQQGIYSAEVVKNYHDQAEAIQAKTGIEAAAIVQAQATAQGLLGQKIITQELTGAVVDFAVRYKMDVGQAFDLVAKAAYGSTAMLHRHGIIVNESLDSNARLAEFVKQVGIQMGGQAEAATKGVGSMKLLAVAFEDLQIAIGERFAPMITAAIKYMTDFINAVSKNQQLLDLAAALLAGAAALAGFVAAAAAGSAAIVGLSTVAGALGISLTALLGPVALVAVAVAALGASLGYLITKKPITELQNLDNQINETKGRIETLRKAAKDPIRNFLGFDDSKDLATEEGRLKSLLEKRKQFGEDSLKIEDAATKARAAAQKSAADKAQGERDAQEKRRMAAEKAGESVLIAEANNESKAMIDIKKKEHATLAKMADEKNKKILKQLKKQLANERKLEVAQHKTDAAQMKKFNNDILKNDKEYQKMSADQQQVFLLKHQEQLQSSIDTEDTALDKAATKRAEIQIASNNKYLQDQIKFGTAYAAINQAMHSEIYDGTKKAFGDMAELQNSHNATMKAIGKAAAAVNIAIKGIEAAMNVFEGFSTIPIVGYALGIAAAGLVVAYTAEQISSVMSANQGGVVPGSGPDQDSVLSYLTPGELVVPRSNFDETVNAVSAQRAGNSSGQASGSGGGADMLSAIAESLKSIDKKFDAPTVINGSVVTDQVFIDATIRKINDAIRFRNARLITQPVGVS